MLDVYVKIFNVIVEIKMMNIEILGVAMYGGKIVESVESMNISSLL